MTMTRILIIDDEKSIRDSFGAHLEDHGYEILTAENGRVGLAMFDSKQPDLVIVDLRMPEIDGIQVLETISQKSPQTPLIVASGTGIITDAVEALHSGAWDYLLKPIEELSMLTHAVSAALEKSQLKKENLAYKEHLECLVEERTTELAEANTNLKQISETLRQSESRLQKILDTVPTGIIIVDAENFDIVYINPAGAKIVGTDPEAITGKAWYEILFQNHNGDWSMMNGRLADQSERLLLNFDGREVPVLKTTTRTQLQGRQCFVVSFIDLTDQIRAELEKEQLESQLRQAQKMEALGTLAGGIAHDFNNILSAVLGYSELGLKDIADTEHPLYPKLKAINHAGHRAKDLVEQIVAFSRMQEQLYRSVKVSTIVEEVLKLLQSSLPANIQIKASIDTEKSVLGDPTQIHQIIMNLCTNAFHSMQASGGTLKIILKAVSVEEPELTSAIHLPPGEFLRLDVSDTGMGISPTIIDRIFEPYFTTKDKDKGTGLGLAVVHGIVKRNGGDISVESQPGKGSRFTIYLPVSEDEMEKVDEDPIILPRGTQHVLLVDDEKDLVEIGKEMLEHLGYRVTGITGSTAAMEAFKEDPFRFDIVVTDYNMPGLTGDQLAKQMMAIRKEIPIIVCTGFSELFNQKRAKAMGIRQTLMKPLTMETLAISVHDALLPT